MKTRWYETMPDSSSCSFPSTRPRKLGGKVNEQRSRWSRKKIFQCGFCRAHRGGHVIRVVCTVSALRTASDGYCAIFLRLAAPRALALLRAVFGCRCGGVNFGGTGVFSGCWVSADLPHWACAMGGLGAVLYIVARGLRRDNTQPAPARSWGKLG